MGMYCADYPTPSRTGASTGVDLRRVIDAIQYLDRTGCQWRLIPANVPPSGTVRSSFDTWNADSTLLEIHDPLRRKVREQPGRRPAPTARSIDRQTVGCPLGVYRIRR
jgi:putative transposase